MVLRFISVSSVEMSAHDKESADVCLATCAQARTHNEGTVSLFAQRIR